ncbi:MFS transporter, partial [Pseudomonas aeruginosa]|nr:MFS transporter [Pseudomonas aeruginosa]
MMLLPIYSEGVLHAGPDGFGFLTTAFAVGALAASAALARGVPPDELPVVLGRAGAVFGVAVAALSLFNSFAAACGVLFVAGWGMM